MVYYDFSLLDKQAKDSYLLYSLHVLKRTIPDVRDGLKPVQRRIIYAMYKNKLFYEGKFVKSVRVVGEVLGKYHPHGDRAVYDTMVKMAQDFILRHPLIASQGNFGSIDGDNAAEPRYTEVKLSSIAYEMVKNIDKETISFLDNFDNTEKEPCVLPSEFPVVLVNGTYGIAVGTMTSIPSHNLSDVIDATLLLLKNKDASHLEILDCIKGPDFATGGEIFKEELDDIYSKGIGSFVCRGKMYFEKNELVQSIVINEIPHGVKKSVILQEISDQRKGKINEIIEIRDETDKSGIRIVIDIPNEVNVGDVAKKILRYTSMQRKIFVNFLLMNGDKLVQMSLKGILLSFIDHKKEICKNRLIFQLKKLSRELSNLKLELFCQKNASKIISILQKHKTKEEIYKSLFALGLDKEGSDYILQMRISKLAKIEEEQVNSKMLSVEKDILYINNILENDINLTLYVENELLSIKKEYGVQRKTNIIVKEDINMNLVDDYPTMVYVVKDRFLFKSREKPKITGIQRSGTTLKNFLGNVSKVFFSSEKSILCMFTNKGRIFPFRPFDMPYFNDEKNIFNLLDIRKYMLEDEKIVNGISISAEQQMGSDETVILVSSKGKISRVSFKDLMKSRLGTTFMSVAENDEIVSAYTAPSKCLILCITSLGKAILFNIDNIRISNRKVQGVSAIKVCGEDKVTDSTYCFNNNLLFAFSQSGYAKGLSSSSIRVTKRGGIGVRFMQLRPSDKVKNVLLKTENTSYLALLTKKGSVLATSFDFLSVNKGRNSFGKRVAYKKDEVLDVFCL